MSDRTWKIHQGPTAFNCPVGGEPMHLVAAHTGIVDYEPSSVGIGEWKCPIHGSFYEDGDTFWEVTDDE